MCCICYKDSEWQEVFRHISEDSLLVQTTIGPPCDDLLAFRVILRVTLQSACRVVPEFDALQPVFCELQLLLLLIEHVALAICLFSNVVIAYRKHDAMYVIFSNWTCISSLFHISVQESKLPCD